MLINSDDGPTPQRGVGIIAPYDFALDREIWRWVPDEVSLYLTRTPRLLLPVTLTMADMISDVDVVHNATLEVLTAEPEVVCYLCTSGSFVRGVDGEGDLRRIMADAGAPAARTAAGALLEAVRELGISRLAIATPYVESVTDRLKEFLAEAGVEVVGSAELGLLERIWQVPYHDVRELVAAADHPDAEAIFVSCTNLATYDTIAPLERALGKPVLTANQVAVWSSLRALGLRSPAVEQRLWQVPDTGSTQLVS